jgi:hypothetical protein
MTIVRFLLRVLPSHLIAACRICAGAAPSALIVTVGLLFGPAAAQGQGGDVSPAAQRKSVTALTPAELNHVPRAGARFPTRSRRNSERSLDSYCDCEANVLVGSVARDKLVRGDVDKQFETKVGLRRQDRGAWHHTMGDAPRRPDDGSH